MEGADEGISWTKIIRPERHALSIPWGELWRYRDLVWMLAVRDVTTSYKQTILGPLWFIVQPFVVTAVFSYLFGRMARFGSNDIPHYLFYMSGLVPWTFLSETITRTSNIFTQNSGLFSKVYFPRLCVPLAQAISNLVPLGAQFVLFLAGLLFYVVRKDPFTHPNWWILATPFIFLQLAMLGVGIGCMVSALSRRFRDLALGRKNGPATRDVWQCHRVSTFADQTG